MKGVLLWVSNSRRGGDWHLVWETRTNNQFLILRDERAVLFFFLGGFVCMCFLCVR